MSKEKFIQGKVDNHRHAGRRSTVRGLESAMFRIRQWRNERTEAHLAGHSIDEIPEDEEIVFFPIDKKEKKV